MSKPAAFFGNKCSCKAHETSLAALPHVGRGVVRVNGQIVHVQGDLLVCAGGSGTLVQSAAATVRVGGRGTAVANLAMTTPHDGMFTPGSRNVMIGGPIVVGDLARWGKACAAAAASRVTAQQMGDPDRAKTPGFQPTQSTDKNCGCEAARQVIWELSRGKDGRPRQPNEYELLEDLVKTGRVKGPHQIDYPGGRPQGAPEADWSEVGETKSGNRHQILSDYGVPTEPAPATASKIEAAVREGNVVITPVYSDFQPQTGQKHVVLTVGIEYDASGRPVAAYVNDSGVPNGCLRRVPWPSYVTGLEKSDSINVVKTGASP
jgi:uncharacterized Zn-binding protein involved in type VI secretion